MKQMHKNEALRSFAIAYTAAYLSTTSPQVLKLFSQSSRKKITPTLEQFFSVFYNGLRLRGVAPFCGLFVFLLQILRKRHSSFLSGTIAGTVSILYLHAARPGKSTTDLTLFTLVRAIDVLFHLNDTLVFVFACSIIMYAYFYSPEKLPPSYNSWINKMSTVDPRIKVMFKKLHDKKIQFGQPSSDRSLEDVSFDLGLDPKMGSIEENDALPCQVFHSNISGSCKVHIAYRWLKGFKSSIAIYVPLSLMLALRDPTTKSFKRALTSAIRSSAFLATFISNLWLGVCATRSIIGPKLFPNVNQNTYDGMIGPTIGSFLSGWSILIETPKRRGELALFVVPKALTVVLPKSIQQHRIIETVIFGLSSGVIIRSLIDGKGRKVRGIFGKTLHWIMNA